MDPLLVQKPYGTGDPSSENAMVPFGYPQPPTQMGAECPRSVPDLPTSSRRLGGSGGTPVPPAIADRMVVGPVAVDATYLVVLAET